MNRLIDAYCRLFKRAMVLLLGMVVVLVFGNVVLRRSVPLADRMRLMPLAPAPAAR